MAVDGCEHKHTKVSIPQGSKGDELFVLIVGNAAIELDGLKVAQVQQVSYFGSLPIVPCPMIRGCGADFRLMFSDCYFHQLFSCSGPLFWGDDALGIRQVRSAAIRASTLCVLQTLSGSETLLPALQESRQVSGTGEADFRRGTSDYSSSKPLPPESILWTLR